MLTVPIGSTKSIVAYVWHTGLIKSLPLYITVFSQDMSRYGYVEGTYLDLSGLIAWIQVRQGPEFLF